MDNYQMEGEIEQIAEKAWADFENDYALKPTLKLAVLNAYKAGMEAARKIYTS